MALAPTLRIAILQGRFPIVDPKTGIPTTDFIDALNMALQNTETIVNNQGDLLNATLAAQAAADAADAAASAAASAAATASTAAATANTAAADAQALAEDVETRIDAYGIP